MKVAAGLGLTYIYTYHYPNRYEADIYKYFDDSAPMYEALFTKPFDFVRLISGIGIDSDYFFNEYFIKMNNWDRAFDSNIYNDSHTIIRFNAVIRIVSFGFYPVHILFFCMLSFIGLAALYRSAKEYLPNSKKMWMVCCFLLPSILLWSSGVLKESILIFALGLLFFTITKVLDADYSKKNGFLILFSLLLLVYIKFYVLFSFIPAVICFVIAKKFISYTPYVYLIFIGIFTFTSFNTRHLPGNINFIDVLIGKQSDFIRLSEWQHAQSGFELTPLENNFWGVIRVIPEGIVNCLIRPLPWHANSSLYWGAILENFFILFFIILSIWHIWKLKIKKEKLFQYQTHLNFVFFCLLFVLILFSIIGITTPVAGALVRYKIPALPFLMLALLLILEKEKHVIPYLERHLKRLQ